MDALTSFFKFMSALFRFVLRLGEWADKKGMIKIVDDATDAIKRQTDAKTKEEIDDANRRLSDAWKRLRS